ncbi:MAG: HEPN domain-containing protein [Proteobacteria bacterium]|nr:HEPN domain-containing protein [Pseudomonadota bacterium]
MGDFEVATGGGFWVAARDIKTADHMFETKRYVYVLFMCHLATEKLIKALYEATTKEMPPKTHNLVLLLR